MIARLIAFPQKTVDSDTGRANRLSEILSLLNRVAAIADDARKDEKTAFEEVFEQVCSFTGWPIGHLYVRDPGDHLRYVSRDVWRLEPDMDTAAIAEFMTLSKNTVFTRGTGLVGIIAETGEARAVEDVTVLPQFLRAEAAQRNEVRGFFGFPVMLDGACVAVAEFYGRQTGLLDDTSLEIMTYVSSQLARVFERQAFEKRRTALMDQFETSVQSAVGRLGAASGELTGSAGELGQRCGATADACAKVGAGIADISAAAGSLKSAMAALDDAERNTESKTSAVIGTVNQLAGELRDAVTQLERSNQAAQDIGEITRNVSEIAGQVRMLGLNATIEAARAGEMGKGFAIVASEIKNLAQQSEAASGCIAEQISGLQDTVRASAVNMASVAGKMEDLVQTVHGMAQVLSGQKQATSTIGRHVADSQETVAGITADVALMDEAMAVLSELSRGLGRLAADLEGTAHDVSHSGEAFMTAMRG
ncbi:GAF domain-containing protein [bacterium SCSIO 12827]|nr:GAF domain-containing protein [bacterium SCSIO 12827]